MAQEAKMATAKESIKKNKKKDFLLPVKKVKALKVKVADLAHQS